MLTDDLRIEFNDGEFDLYWVDRTQNVIYSIRDVRKIHADRIKLEITLQSVVETIRIFPSRAIYLKTPTTLESKTDFFEVNPADIFSDYIEAKTYLYKCNYEQLKEYEKTINDVYDLLRFSASHNLKTDEVAAFAVSSKAKELLDVDIRIAELLQINTKKESE